MPTVMREGRTGSSFAEMRAIRESRRTFMLPQERARTHRLLYGAAEQHGPWELVGQGEVLHRESLDFDFALSSIGSASLTEESPSAAF